MAATSPIATRIFVAVLVLFLGLADRCSFGATHRPPNILLILADDLGFSDLGCYGGEIATPRLDSLARDGLRFTQFYNTSRCWPTRAALLTGYYPQAIRRDLLPPVGGGANGSRPVWARLLPDHLAPLGYRSYHSGKWHIDGGRLAGGFHRSYSIEDHDRNFGPRQHLLDDARLPPATGDGYFTSTAIADHAIRCLADHASQNGDRPFFQFLCFTSPHFPLQAPAADIDRYRERYQAGWETVRAERARRQRSLHLPLPRPGPSEPEVRPAWNLDETALAQRIDPREVGRAVPWASLTPEQRRFQADKMAVHAAMVDRMDREIGRVLDQVRAMGAWDNTVIVFLSDNGASAEQIVRGDGHDPTQPAGSAGTFLCLGPGWSTAANTPFRLHKSWTHEGGIATPLIVHWPAGIREHQRGSLRRTPGHVVDLPPTLLELAGGRWPSRWGEHAMPEPHGRSLVPALVRDRTLPRQPIWWFHDRHRALRDGDWKLVSTPVVRDDTPPVWELYNLRRDRAESRNVAARHPERVAEMAAAWETQAREFRRLAAPSAP